ncbi:hypothetical protein ABK046_46415, partial [Streptomyces caeruleatus]
MNSETGERVGGVTLEEARETAGQLTRLQRQALTTGKTADASSLASYQAKVREYSRILEEGEQRQIALKKDRERANTP